MLIGRAAQLAELTAALDRAAAGSAGVALVSGDAGVGKTHIVSALTRAARERGCAVLVGQCAELGESMPYLPLADALWTAARAAAPEAAAVRAALEARPVLGLLLPDGEGAPGAASEVGQQQLFGAVLGLLGELGRERPVLLVLEDLHWADRSTRHLLTFLSRVLQRERVCLVGTYRTDDLHRRHPLRPVVAELLRLPNVTGVEVAPFGPAETADYLTALAGGTAPVTADVVERVHQRSEGNAFYAAELYSAESTGEELPAGLADLLLSRVERLSEDAQRVLRVAAVAGRRVDDELLRRVSGLDEASAGEALREVVSHQLLVPAGTGYSFRHALLREAVYADLLPGERTRLHAGYAELLSDGGPAARRGSAAELAAHSLAAHDLPAAFAASVRAGREAERLGAPAEAFEHLDRALELWDTVPDAAAVAGTDRMELSLAAVRASGRAGELRRAISQLRRLLDLADPADTTLGARIREHLASYLADIDEDDEALAIGRAAVAMLEPDAPGRVRAAVLATYTRLLLYKDPDEEMPRLAEDAVAAARAAGAGDAEASLLVTLGLYRESREADDAVAEVFASARDLAAAEGDQPVALRAAFHHARTRFDRGDLAGATVAADEGVRLALDNGLEWSPFGTVLRSLQYLVHYTTGDWDEAARLADGFAVRVVRPPEARVSAYALFLEVARGGPGVDERLRWIAPLWRGDSFLAYVARGLAAERALWRGDVDAAIEHVTAVLDVLHPYETGIIRIAATGLWAQAERAARARAAGDEATAADAVRVGDDLLSRAHRVAATTWGDHPRAWLGLEGHAWLARAEAERRRLEGDHDPEPWRRSADLFTYGGDGFVYEVARSRYRLVEALVESGDREEAAERWRSATAIAERLGAVPLLTALRELGTRARLGPGRPAAGPAGAASGPFAALTVREREVLELVAEGRGNREIAAALFISPKTASVHVSNILAKLNVTSRTQAAALAHRDGL